MVDWLCNLWYTFFPTFYNLYVCVKILNQIIINIWIMIMWIIGVGFACCFLWILFHSTFSISYKIVFWLGIIFWLGSDRPSGLLFFVPALLLSMHTHVSLLTFFVCFFILFHSWCVHERAFGKTLGHEFRISYSHTDWYLFFRSAKLMNNWKQRAIKQIIQN